MPYIPISKALVIIIGIRYTNKLYPDYGKKINRITKFKVAKHFVNLTSRSF